LVDKKFRGDYACQGKRTRELRTLDIQGKTFIKARGGLKKVPKNIKKFSAAFWEGKSYAELTQETMQPRNFFGGETASGKELRKNTQKVREQGASFVGEQNKINAVRRTTPHEN